MSGVSSSCSAGASAIDAVTLISGILVLADKDADKIYIFIAFVPVLFFWYWIPIIFYRNDYSVYY